MANLGGLAHEQGRLDEARAFDERALAIYQKSLGPEHPHVATVLDDLGGIALDSGRADGARDAFERALAIREKALGPEHDVTAKALAHLGKALAAQGEVGRALELHARAVALQEKALGADAVALVEPLTGLGEDYLLLRQPAKALVPLERATSLGELKASAGDPANLAAARFALARALWAAGGDRARAVDLTGRAREALAARQEAYGRELARTEAWLLSHKAGRARGRLRRQGFGPARCSRPAGRCRRRGRHGKTPMRSLRRRADGVGTVLTSPNVTPRA